MACCLSRFRSAVSTLANENEFDARKTQVFVATQTNTDGGGVFPAFQRSGE
jgi:hypothetical protein